MHELATKGSAITVKVGQLVLSDAAKRL